MRKMSRLPLHLLAPALLLLVPAALRAQLQPGLPCLVSNPGYSSCIGYVTFSSFVTNGPFKPFQADPYSGGWQQDITLNFSPAIAEFRYFTFDPDYPGNKVYVYLSNFGYLTYLSPAADGQPGVFSVGGGGLRGGPFYRLILHSDPNDYVNWFVEYRARSNSTYWCRVQYQTTNCDGVKVTTSPWAQGSPFDPFQSADNYSGAQGPIDIQFGAAAYAVSVTAVDADYGGSRMEAYGSDGSLLGTVYFDGDNQPGFTSYSTKTLTDSRGIWKVRLINDPSDYVAWQGLTVTPGY